MKLIQVKKDSIDVTEPWAAKRDMVSQVTASGSIFVHCIGYVKIHIHWGRTRKFSLGPPYAKGKKKVS